MLLGKSRPAIRKLSRGHHSAFVYSASSTQHSATIHCPSICSSTHQAFIHPSIHSVTYLSTQYSSVIQCPSIHPSLHPPTVSIQHPLIPQSTHSVSLQAIQLSFSICICSNVCPSHLSIYSQGTDPSFHSSTGYGSNQPSFTHSNSNDLSYIQPTSTHLDTRIPWRAFSPGGRWEGCCPGDSETSTLLPKDYSSLESFLVLATKYLFLVSGTEFLQVAGAQQICNGSMNKKTLDPVLGSIKMNDIQSRTLLLVFTA